MNSIYKLTLVFLYTSLASFAQGKVIDDLRHYHLDSASFYEIYNKQPQIYWQQQFLKDFDVSKPYYNLATINAILPTTNQELFYAEINQGDYYFYKYLNKNIEAFNHYKNALKIAKDTDNIVLQCEALKKILTFHRIDYLYDNVTYKIYLKSYKELAYDDFEKANYHYYNLILNFKNYKTSEWVKESQTFLDNYFLNNQNEYLKGITYTVYTSYYEEMGESDNIWFYAFEAEKAFKNIHYNFKDSRLIQLYILMVRIAVREKRLEIAKVSLEKAAIPSKNKIDYKVQSIASYYEGVLDTINGDFKSAFYKYLEHDVSQDSIRKGDYSNLINELNIKYQTAEKEKQLLLAAQENKQQQFFLAILAAVLVLGSIIAIQINRNTKRKQRIAEQEREIEIQKIETLLKEQELTTIDAMIEGQEKERQRLAGDLHDNVGATLAAAKLQFEHLKNNREKAAITEELFSKTSQLLDDAYNEIRNISHLKNSGVMAKDGLLPAVQKLANNASVNGKLEIEVSDFGLHNRIENTLEISLFRAIQELVTNIIKHSKATEASIAITQHEGMINIIIEDNGIGISENKRKKNTHGMGLENIEKRVEHLDGTFEIDSSPKRGTTVIIDVPVN